MVVIAMKIRSICSILVALSLSAGVFAQKKVSPVKLDGMIRLANKERLEVGDAAPIRVRLMHTGGTSGNSPAKVTVVVTTPTGATLNQGTRDVQVPFNEYGESNFDFLFPVAGTYKATATATGENGSKWIGSFTFTTFAKKTTGDKGSIASTLETGTYEAKVDVRMPSGSTVSHILSLTYSKGPHSNLTIKGWMAPAKGDGYHFQINGTWDGVSRNQTLSSHGTDGSDHKCDISLVMNLRASNSLTSAITITSKSTPQIMNQAVFIKK